ncbi:MAG: J domain-containing protein [Nanoarchaeota archaeon]
MPVNEFEQLELSDLMTEVEEDIKRNPYTFLNLPEDAPLEDARRAYLRLARMYHPDMVRPESSSGLRSLWKASIPEGLSHQEMVSHIQGMRWNDPDAIEKSTAIGRLRALAHEKMVVLNRAYREILSRHGKADQLSVCGYDFISEFNAVEGFDNQVVSLEGRGHVRIFPNHHQGWVAGAYLTFDFGPDYEAPNPDMAAKWRQELLVRHLFAHLEFRERKMVTPFLLAPFFECFGFDAQRKAGFLAMLADPAIPYYRVGQDIGIDGDSIMQLRFRHQLNQILFLRNRDEEMDGYFSGQQAAVIKDGELIIGEGEHQTRFSEADHMLLATLAYGPTLKGEKRYLK